MQLSMVDTSQVASGRTANVALEATPQLARAFECATSTAEPYGVEQYTAVDGRRS